MIDKQIAVLGGPGRIEAHWKVTAEDAFMQTGMNTGNLAFQYGLTKSIKGDVRFISPNFDPSELNDSAEILCIPAANFIYSSFDFDFLARQLEKCRLPLLVVGLGIQATANLNEISLTSGTKRLLSIFSERCKSILVRGHYTLEYLGSIGIKNAEIFGCPSQFINFSPCLGKEISTFVQRWGERPLSVAYAPTFYEQNSQLEQLLAQAMQNDIAEIVCQEPLEAIKIARRTSNHISRRWAESSASGFLSRLSPQERGRALSRFKAYFSIDDWISSYQRHDLVFGSRIHGVALGWQAGRPAFLAAHDLRTVELAAAIGLPYSEPHNLPEVGMYEFIEAKIMEGADALDNLRRRRALQYVEVLEAVGVTPCDELMSLVERPTSFECQSSSSATMAPAPRRQGFLETYSISLIQGWVEAADCAQVVVGIYFNGVEVGRVTPDQPRSDLPSNCLGFNWSVPDGLITARETTVSVRVIRSSGSYSVINSPNTIYKLNESEIVSTVKGKSGALFSNDPPAFPFDYAVGVREFPDGILDKWCQFVEDLRIVSKDRELKAVLWITPCKEVCLADHLPSPFNLSPSRPVNQLLSRVAALGLSDHVIYAARNLDEAALGECYPAGDSHPDGQGAALFIESLLVDLQLTSSAQRIREKVLDQIYETGDLQYRVGATSVVRKRRLLPSTDTFESTYSWFPLRHNRLRHFKTVAKCPGRSLLFVHDWHGQELVVPLAESFAETTSLFSHQIDTEILDKLKPTHLIVQHSETFLVDPLRFI